MSKSRCTHQIIPGPVVDAAIVAVFRELRPRSAGRPGIGRRRRCCVSSLCYHRSPRLRHGFMRSLRIICPNGHLGFAPIRVESFRLGVAARPDCIAADSGSDDVGPIPLGTDTSTSPRAWQTHDLEHMLLASRELGVPMIIGSAGDTGTNSRVDLYVQIIKDLAAKHALPRFKLGYFYSEVGKEDLRRRMRAGETVAGLEGYEALTEAELDATERIVAMAGVHPFIKLLEAGRRRHHRRAQQRQLRFRRAGNPSRLCRRPRVLPRQSARVRVVLRRAVRRQGDGAGGNHRGRRAGHGDASRAALHRGLGRRACDVRAVESVFRARGGRDPRHVGVPLRAGRAGNHAHLRREVRAAPRSFASSSKARARSASATSAWSASATRTRSPTSTR